MLNQGGQDAWKAGHRLNGDLLGFKFGAWEGGHRVPLIVRWPGKVPSKTTSDALISHIDLITTFAAAAGSRIPEGAIIDGVNQLAEFMGKADKPARDFLVISPNSPTHLTLRKNEWVYIPAQNEGGFQGRRAGDHLFGGAATQAFTKLINSDVVDSKIRKDAPQAQLYDLKKDPRQQNNVHDQHPEVVAKMADDLEKWRKEIRGPKLGWINAELK